MQKLLIQIDRILCWAATNIYPEGNGVKQDLINYKITNKPLKVLANGNVNGINTTYFNLSQVEISRREEIKNRCNITESDFVFMS